MKRLLMMFAALALLAGCSDSDKAQTGQNTAPSSQTQTLTVAEETQVQAINQGVAKLRSGEVKDAISHFDQAIKENPQDVRGYLVLGQTYMHLKDYNRAIDTFTAATQVAPSNGEAHYLLATNYGMAGNFSMAKLEAEKCLVIFRQQNDPDNFKRALALLQGMPQEEKQTMTK